MRDGAALNPGPYICLSVSDSGSGMDKQMFERLFHPFVTTKGEAGTGLGLWVSKGILDKHNARVAVRSKSGFGTVFRMTLPVTLIVRSLLAARDDAAGCPGAQSRVRTGADRGERAGNGSEH